MREPRRWGFSVSRSEYFQVSVIKGETERAGSALFKQLRQVIESINDTVKGQLDLEHHGGHTIAGVTVRVLQRILALTAEIWHNHHTQQPVLRSLTAYDH